jgi:hypothetical protein
MADYDWREHQDQVLMRFPGTANGFDEWLSFTDSFPSREFDFVAQPERIKCPRVFISHKQADEQIARRIAWLAVQEKFEFWLDVLDPPLQAFLAQKGHLSPLEESRLTAAIIEMGLINCTHVVAAITRQSRPSRWIPYEYGRVKDSKSLVGSTASWVSPSEKNSFPEYLHLGNISYTEQELRSWLRQEFEQWKQDHPDSHLCSGGKWKTEVPAVKLDDVS